MRGDWLASPKDLVGTLSKLEIRKFKFSYKSKLINESDDLGDPVVSTVGAR